MPTHTTIAPPSEKSARAPCSASPRDVVASSRPCPICGTALTGRQQACSGRCRAAKSRQRREAREARVRELLERTLGELGDG
jgi:predicted nucleic acid-binding Zn ribbon protein